MRLIICLFLSSLNSINCHGQKKTSDRFTLNGKIFNSKNPKIYLIYETGGKRVTDSCELTNETFTFNGYIHEPTWAVLRGNSKIMDDAENPNIVDFYLEPTIMTVFVKYDHFKETKFANSKSQVEYEELTKEFSHINKHSETIAKDFSNVAYNYILKHPNSYVSAVQLMLRKTRWPLDSVKYLYSIVTPRIQKSFYGKSIKETIEDIVNNSVGKPAKDFKTVDISGNDLRLSDFKGKYVLLDFWGSWCGPCRQSTPHLKKLFTTYNKSGFNVIGIAEEYDETGSAWRKAVNTDSTDIWHNVLSKTKFANPNGSIDSTPIVKKYGVKVFPTKILIDKKGIILGRYNGSDDDVKLDRKLEEIFQ